MRTFIDLVTEIGRLAFRLSAAGSFFGTTRNVRVGSCDHDVIGLDQALREADRAAGLDHVGLDREPLPDIWRQPTKSTASEIVTSDD